MVSENQPPEGRARQVRGKIGNDTDDALSEPGQMALLRQRRYLDESVAAPLFPPRNLDPAEENRWGDAGETAAKSLVLPSRISQMQHGT